MLLHHLASIACHPWPFLLYWGGIVNKIKLMEREVGVVDKISIDQIG